MKIFNYIIVAVFTCLIGLTTNCKKDSPSPAPLTQEERINLNINQFIWGGLNYWYLWVDSVPQLSDSYFQNDTNKLNDFLKPYSDHEKLFNDLLYKNGTVDKWSWIVDDYTQLLKELNGVNTTKGFEFALNYVDETKTNVVGYVTYVLKGSPADQKGIKRGDLFTKIDGNQLTVSNYSTLLFGNNTNTISFATYNKTSNTLTSNGKEITLTGVEMQENPILFDTIYNISGTKVGYLVYNGFISGYDLQLNEVFKNFKDAGIQKLILDLRYNGGGSVQSAVYLASMIYSTDKNKAFIRTHSNRYTLTDSYLNTTDYFTDTIARTASSNAPTYINTLNLTQLYVLGQRNSTASASELVINGLKAYIPVNLFGSGTVGKYVGSVTLLDWDSKGNVNPNNKWAMQPIVFISSNVNGESYYKNGFTPKVSVTEDYKSIMPLGNPKEPFLQAALNDIQGLTQTSALKSVSTSTLFLGSSKDHLHHSKDMYLKMKPIPGNKLIHN